MIIVPKDYIEVKYQQIARLRGEEMMVPFVLLKDDKQRTIALPLDCPQGKLIRDTLEENGNPSQPHQTLLDCIKKLGAELKYVCMHHSKNFDLPTSLVLELGSGEEVEIGVSCVDGIAYAQMAGKPIYVAKELMLQIGATSNMLERRCKNTVTQVKN